MIDQNNELPYLPYHAIHEFMRPDFRSAIVKTVLTALPGLPDPQRLSIERLTRMQVVVPGFRNSAKAPLPMRIRLTAEVLVKSPQLTAAILEAWAGLQTSLRQLVYEFLRERGWALPPDDGDRTSLPGFKPEWPKGEGFAEIATDFRTKHPEHTASDDEISLMAVWVSGSLPYLTDEDHEPDQ